MKKRLLAVGAGITAVILLIFIFFPKEKTEDLKMLHHATGEMKNELKFISSENTGGYKDGYFYIKDSDMGERIMFFDYKAKREVYLCSKPNCSHEDETCSSFLVVGENNELFYYDGYLYLVNAQAAGNIVSFNFDGSVSEDSNGLPTTIYRMNLDGTDKKRLFTVPDGTEMSLPFVLCGNTLYGILDEYKIEYSGSLASGKTLSSSLIAVDLDSGKYEEVAEGKNKSIAGTYQNKIVLHEIDYAQDPELFDSDPSGYVANLYNSKIKIKLLDLENKTEEIIYEDIFKNMENFKLYKDSIIFIGQNSSILQCLDLNTKEVRKLADLPKTGLNISAVSDDKILLFDYKDEEAHANDAYYVDLTTNHVRDFHLKDEEGYLIEILSANDDYYFVRTQTVFGEEYTTWAGTKQRDILESRYGLIKKEDYWNSVGNYIPMTNAD